MAFLIGAMARRSVNGSRSGRTKRVARLRQAMKQAFIVGLGGFIGSIGRYKLGGIILHHTPSWRFPLSTFAINVMGCFVIGALAALVEHRDLFSSDTRLFLFTGLLGGFTTFSAFGYEG